MKIILLRHGETMWNRERRLQGCKDLPLTKEGEGQIYNTGRRLAEYDLKIDRIIASPLQRTYKTAKIVANALNYPLENIVNDADLVERGMGVGEGMLYEEAVSKYPDHNYPGMETIEELCSRVKRVIDRCERSYSDKTVLLVTHGGTIRALLTVLTKGNIPYSGNEAWLENGNICLLGKQGKAWEVIMKE